MAKFPGFCNILLNLVAILFLINHWNEQSDFNKRSS